MVKRVTSRDSGYVAGDISLFPDALDDKDSLYEARNNAETKLKAGLAYNGKKIIVESTSAFPNKGILRVGPMAGQQGEAELIYYGLKTQNTFQELERGFAGSRQNQWPTGSWATNSVMAEHHNAIKDALIKIETRTGVKNNPDEGSLNKRVKDLELRFLSPKAAFRAFPKTTTPRKAIKFQNFSEGPIIRYLWDFGDGAQSVLESPTHVYESEGIYTVKLHLITGLGAQGISTKNDYITVSFDEKPSYFYAKRISGRKYLFVDQTDGDIKQRFWVFGDDTEPVVENDPNIHYCTHEYASEGSYQPSVLISFTSDKIKRVFLSSSSLEVT